MRRQDGQGIADRLVDLRLREVADLDQARAGDVSTGEVSPREIGLIEQSLRQVSAGKIGAIQTRLTKIGVGEVSAGKVGPVQGGKAERAVPETRSRKVDRAAIDLAHLPLGGAQADAG
jgi:hypothetical protein